MNHYVTALTGFRRDRPANWIDGDYRHTLYSTSPRNSTTYDCLAARISAANAGSGIPVASICTVDGSSIRVTTINRSMWCDIGTIAGGEVVSSECY